MPRCRRHIISKQVYEITLRAKSGIPFPPADYMNLLIEGALARVQRDNKVDICHIVFMGNHVHILVIVYDQVQAVSFVKELKKSLTDMTKRLLGMRYLNLWEDSSIIYLATAEDITKRIIYLYSNPATAALESSVEKYPGISSWKSFQAARAADVSPDFRTVKVCPWITADKVPLIKHGVNKQRDERLVQELTESSLCSHDLVIKPNAWMKIHNIDREEGERINTLVYQTVFENEEQLCRDRLRSHKGIIGATALKSRAPTLQGHKPKKRGQRLFVICYDEELRRDIIIRYREFCDACYECYLHYCRTFEVLQWPPGAFMPALPPRVSSLSLY